LIVGGNIAGYMRIMTTAIVLKTSEMSWNWRSAGSSSRLSAIRRRPGKYLLVA
jgi:hypothetical protein